MDGAKTRAAIDQLLVQAHEALIDASVLAERTRLQAQCLSYERAVVAMAEAHLLAVGISPAPSLQTGGGDAMQVAFLFAHHVAAAGLVSEACGQAVVAVVRAAKQVCLLGPETLYPGRAQQLAAGVRQLAIETDIVLAPAHELAAVA